MPETNFLWDPLSDNILQERNAIGALTAEYTTEPGLYGNVISQNRGGTDSQFHFDVVGSTLALTNDSQQETDNVAYTAFGQVTETSGSTVNPFQYVGQKEYYKDSASDEYIARRRPYEPLHGRWNCIDPIVALRGTNAYLYALNSPQGHTDPSGLTVFVFGWEGFGGKIGASYSPIGDVYQAIAEKELGEEVKMSVKATKHLYELTALFPDAKSILKRAKTLEVDNGCIKCYPRIVLIGYSWGGNYATKVAAAMQYLDRTVKIDAVFTIDPVFEELGGTLAGHDEIFGFKLFTPRPVTIKPKNFCAWNNYWESTSRNPPFVGDKLAFATKDREATARVLRQGPYANLPPGLPFPNAKADAEGHNYIPYLLAIQDDWRTLMASFKKNSLRNEYSDCEPTCPTE